MSAELMPLVHHLIVHSDANRTWRTRGAAVDPRRFAELLRDAHHSAVELNREGEPVALYELLSMDAQDGHAELSVVTFGRATPADVFLGAALFIRQCFELTPIRQLYAFVSSGATIGAEELGRFGMRSFGRLPEHVFLDGAYRDLHIYCLRREDLPALVDKATRPIEPSALLSSVDEVAIACTGERLTDLAGDLRLMESGLDSLALAEILGAIEDVRGHCLEADWFEGVGTIEQLRSFVEESSRR
jgi:acyl carrier protein